MNEIPVKKHYSFLMCLLVAFSSFLFSCGGGSNTGSGGSKNPEDSNKCKITVATTEGGKVKISKYLETSENVLIGSEVEVVATPDDGYIFTGWYVGNSSEPISTDAVFLFVATKNSTLTAHFAKDLNLINGHKFVDLGLPSGLKWAICNVGANNPWEYGGYYAWGETEEKSNYEWNTYKWCNGSSKSKTKYCTNGRYGTVDNKTVLDPQDDVAHVKWGGTWRIPTKAELNELSTNCIWTWTTQSGVPGYSVTGPNGNSIFLPAAGVRDGTEARGRGGVGCYWSLSLSSDDSDGAYALCFVNGDQKWNDGDRSNGLSVRPVCGVTVYVGCDDGGSVAINGNSGMSVTLDEGSTVTVIATPDEDCDFIGWFIGDEETPVSTDAENTFTVIENLTLTAKFSKRPVVGIPEPVEEQVIYSAPPEEAPEDPAPIEPISIMTPEPSVNPVELDKTVDDVVKRVTKFKKKVDKIKKPKKLQKSKKPKQPSPAPIAQAIEYSCDKTAAKTSSKSSPSKSQSSSSASANPGLPNFELTDRKLVGKLAEPKFVGDEQGKIVVDICVNADGVVTKASCNRKYSNISDSNLRKAAEKAAMKTKFSEAVNNKNDQWGTITYYF